MGEGVRTDEVKGFAEELKDDLYRILIQEKKGMEDVMGGLTGAFPLLSANPCPVDGIWKGDHFEEGGLSGLGDLEGSFNGWDDLVRLYHALAVHAESFHHPGGAEDA